MASRELMSGSQYRACWAVCQPLEDPSPAALTAPPNPQTPQQLVLVLPCGVHDPRAWRGRHMESSDPPNLDLLGTSDTGPPATAAPKHV